jgi:molecular chaperone DnaK (HSP70)
LEKVPTIISYKNGKPHNWGYEVNVLNEEKFQWFKLLLDSNKKLTDDVEAVSSSRNLLKSLNKTAEDVAADYLRLLWQYTKDHIERNEGDSWELIYSLRVVLTVPAIWSPIAKEKTIRAAIMAGLPENIVLVAEPEAAALAVLKEKHDDNKLEIGDCFVVCDAGGGTVVSRPALSILSLLTNQGFDLIQDHWP